MHFSQPYSFIGIPGNNMKSIKLFQNGKRLKDVYPYATKWQVLKYNVSQWFRDVLKTSLIVLLYIAFAATVLNTVGVSEAYEATDVPPVPRDTLSVKIEELQNEVLDILRECESPGFVESDGLVTYDNNSKGTLKGEDVFSYGAYQWKVKTVKHFVQKRDGKIINTKDAIGLALSVDSARALAKYAIFETEGGVYHWENCAIKRDLVRKVSFIKKLAN
jgi:hypothetical protein